MFIARVKAGYTTVIHAWQHAGDRSLWPALYMLLNVKTR